MTANHALFLTFDGPSEGRESQALEIFNAQRTFWSSRKNAGDILGFETVMLSSTRNENMPAGFFLITGERSKLQDLRWNNDEFLNLHTQTMMTFRGYACIDGYTGASLDKHLERVATFMKK